ncbi:calcium homeostasis modulator protein isoform X2 [Parasteatoda tepidariorum]|nr:calcium homeostasis modulator protein isoform X3 [Parasteatoda tepidariorum]XP_042905084.1 calcium homeostasis modulator protein isoform X3 [Parasteatoda tepidariorum]
MGVAAIWTKVTSISRSFSNIFETHLFTVANIIGVVLAFGSEYLIEENGLFSCPCIKELAYAYGLSFIFGGFALFWLLGLIVYAQTWKACHGCYHVSCSKQVCCFYFISFITVCCKTMIVPVAWIFAIVLDGDYIACMMADMCTVESEDYQKFKKLSQHYGLWALCGLFAVVCFIRSCAACCNSDSYLHYTFSKAYRKVEEEALFNSKSETVDGLAKEVVRNFLQKKDLKEEDWRSATDENQDLGLFFSPLHKLVENKKSAGIPLLPIPEVKPEEKKATDSSTVQVQVE